MKNALRVCVVIAACLIVATLVLASSKQVRGTDPTVVNTLLTTPDTEVCFTHPSDIMAFEIHGRLASDIKMAFAVGTSGTTYFTIPGGGVYFSDKIFQSTNQVMCWQSATPSEVVEMILWR